MGTVNSANHTVSTWIDIEHQRLEAHMLTVLMRILAAGALGMAVLAQTSVAQEFNPRLFFDELSARGVKTESVDPDKFFEEIRATGASAENKMDPEKFFDELKARGASTPAGFNSGRFFDDLAATGVKTPSMVNTGK